ncbi:hypothetical protein I8751_11040 [Nostocaceae cyanobacterium CENA357]|uniref:Uncharacterized protein n=1 Tax=Atlanticothrix silvestris CENA357 TaxID=1725252 RepID=A0A8J7L241_9CYAN|nr:hypothetical protein [Atlanticothrix silvestris]MBH8552894.1 hypothetical protein [Atlanticothrix silvestris CENA357]
MKNLVPIIGFGGILCPLFVTAPIIAFAEIQKPKLPTTPPNTLLSVEIQKGNCPKTIGVWTNFRYYEGGGEHTVIADTYPIAGVTKLKSAGKKFVEYTAPLKQTYTSCVGRAIHKELPYRLSFQNGQVLFRVDLPKDTPSNPSEFSTRAILGSRPYVKWAIAD